MFVQQTQQVAKYTLALKRPNVDGIFQQCHSFSILYTYNQFLERKKRAVHFFYANKTKKFLHFPNAAAINFQQVTIFRKASSEIFNIHNYGLITNSFGLRWSLISIFDITFVSIFLFYYVGIDITFSCIYRDRDRACDKFIKKCWARSVC